MGLVEEERHPLGRTCRRRDTYKETSTQIQRDTHAVGLVEEQAEVGEYDPESLPVVVHLELAQ